jgi:hypothetical protein
MRRLVLPLLLLPLLGGCTTLSAGDCLHADWYETGYLAAAAGRPPSDALRFQNACALYGIAPSRRDFAEGWTAGAASRPSRPVAI